MSALNNPIWQALRPSQRDKLLEEHRDWNVDGCIEWWDCIYSDIDEDMAAIGVTVGEKYFSGFWSQGDGACFEFEVTDWSKFVVAAGYPQLEALVKDQSLTFRGVHRGHYYHSNCVIGADSDLLLCNPYTNTGNEGWGEEDNPNWLQRDTWDLVTENGYILSEDELMKFMRGHMDAFYKSLEAEHDYLTTDEAVVESLLCNDMLDEPLEERLNKRKQRRR